jgi:hypothetical protein
MRVGGPRGRRHSQLHGELVLVLGGVGGGTVQVFVAAARRGGDKVAHMQSGVLHGRPGNPCLLVRKNGGEHVSGAEQRVVIVVLVLSRHQEQAHKHCQFCDLWFFKPPGMSHPSCAAAHHLCTCEQALEHIARCTFSHVAEAPPPIPLHEHPCVHQSHTAPLVLLWVVGRRACIPPCFALLEVYNNTIKLIDLNCRHFI